MDPKELYQKGIAFKASVSETEKEAFKELCADKNLTVEDIELIIDAVRIKYAG